MGKANVGYFTTNKVNHSPMTGAYFDKSQRKEKADINSKTNFISSAGDGSFEIQPKKFEYGMQPSKGAADVDGISALISDLKSHHFNMGK